MDANGLRRTFVDFFVEKGHTRVPSSSLIPHDETLLFTNAGMVPFKPYFLGEETAPYRTATTVQKCVRAGGKHNDLDEVGRTSRHLTFFEMLGNFSFGDYFKDIAIPYAWEFITDVLGIDPDKLWITVHLTDDDAETIWREKVGVAAERIQRLDDDNWWRMADTGPNGPCSEIFFDRGPEFGDEGGPAHGGEERYIEIWNLVFMQFDQRADGEQIELPKPSIDTGAGLERILSVLQGVDSVWGTDEFVALLGAASALTGVADGDSPASDVSLRILADHARSTTMLISDGVFPSNEKRGYVLRRIMRRAIRHAYILGVQSNVMPGMVDTVVDLMGIDYPDLARNHEFVRDVVEREETQFRRTLAAGSAILDEAIAGLADGAPLPGDVAFKLHDTYGFPLEVTQEIATEQQVSVDQAGFDQAMAEQRSRAKAARKMAGPAGGADLTAIADEHGPTEFVGRSIFDTETTVLYADGDTVVLDRTPFYAESGGQVGDTGSITTESGRALVTDTSLAPGGLHRHAVTITEGEIEAGQPGRATIDLDRRNAIRRNHTATHVLHWALRKVLGDHVKQQGSWVGPDRLRFDFSHYEALSPETLVELENVANDEILDNATVRHYETTKDHAEEIGAIAFFGDKYGDVVRVLEAGRHSVELCGGTHVGALGDIGPLKIISEGSIGSNLRRIEAITGHGPIERLRAEEAILAESAELIGVPPDELVDGIAKRLDETKALRAELAKLKRQAAVGRAGELAAHAIDGVVVEEIVDIDREGLRDLAVAVRDKGVGVVVLGTAPAEGGAALAAAVAADSGFHAGELIKDAARTIGGGGKPQADVSVAGGREPEKIPEALEQVRAALVSQSSGK